MILRYITRNLRRNGVKSILLIVASLILVLFVSLYAVTINEKNIRLASLGESVAVYLYVQPVDGGTVPLAMYDELQEQDMLKPYYSEINTGKGLHFLDLAGQERLKDTGTGAVVALTDIEKYSLASQEYIRIEYAPQYNADIFAGKADVGVIDRRIAEKLGLTLGDEVRVALEWNDKPYSTDYTVFTKGKKIVIAGVYDATGKYAEAKPETMPLLLPFETMRNIPELFYDGTAFYGGQSTNQTFVDLQVKATWLRCDIVSFKLKDNRNLNELYAMPSAMASMCEKYKSHLTIDDVEYVGTVKPLEQNVALLQRLFPVAVAVACLLGGGIPGLIIIQSAKEAAVMRILGTTKRRTRLTLVLEQLSLCTLGLLLGTAALLILHGAALAPILPKLALCAALYLGACLLATTLCATIVTRGKALELLQTKE